MTETLPFRKEVPLEETWDISGLFTSDDEFYQTLTKHEYLVKDSISAYDYALSAYNAYKEDISVFFLKEAW